MNRLLKKIQGFVVDDAGGETAEWAGVVSIVIAIGIAVYNAGLQAAIQSAVDSIITTVASLAP